MRRNGSTRIDKVRGPFNVGVLQQVAATVMLDHYDELKRHAALMVAERERLFAELQKLPASKRSCQRRTSS